MGQTHVLTGPQQFVYQGTLIRVIRVDGATVRLYTDLDTRVVAIIGVRHRAVAALVAALTGTLSEETYNRAAAAEADERNARLAAEGRTAHTARDWVPEDEWR